jgi:hypothetical protein
MTEQALKNFFENKIDALTLATALNGSQTPIGRDSTHIAVGQLEDEDDFPITTDHLVKLCDAVLEGQLQLIDLNTIAFAMMFSDTFDWDGENDKGRIVSETVFAWDNPEIDYALTTENVRKWKHYLTTGESVFDPQELKRRK